MDLKCAKHVQVVFIIDTTAFFSPFLEPVSVHFVLPIVEFFTVNGPPNLEEVEFGLIDFKNRSPWSVSVVNACGWVKCDVFKNLLSKLCCDGCGTERSFALNDGLVSAYHLFGSRPQPATPQDSLRLGFLITNAFTRGDEHKRGRPTDSSTPAELVQEMVKKFSVRFSVVTWVPHPRLEEFKISGETFQHNHESNPSKIYVGFFDQVFRNPNWKEPKSFLKFLFLPFLP
eukprot:TRINITY_DN8703_c0_g2_i1.p1 TRINITY_DN8703_c0_g2~~TRINITY_DN8703_c0_g2_i1.p1  ORF type:complete len:229 (+),score=39.38 TRINITY_DN8703_c0_g2_i1:63-749(+)